MPESVVDEDGDYNVQVTVNLVMLVISMILVLLIGQDVIPLDVLSKKKHNEILSLGCKRDKNSWL